MPSSTDLWWRDAWSFLSLDRVLHFFRDLWFWIDDPVSFQIELRGQLDGWTASADAFYEDAGELNHVASTWFVARYGLERYAYLAAWMRRLYAREGSIRAAEHEWRNITIEMARSPSAALDGLDPETRSGIAKLYSAHATEYRRLDARISAAGDSPLTSWDSRVLVLDFDEEANDWDSHVEHTTDLIMLTADYNSFLELWDRFCSKLSSAQLGTLYELGKTFALRMGVGPAGDGEHIHFPGSWQPEARWFLAHLQS